MKYKYYQSLYDNSFAVIAPRVCNTLPRHLYQIADLQNLKNRPTHYLNSIPEVNALFNGSTI